MGMYVLQIKQGCEEYVHSILREKGFDALLPKKQIYLRYHGRWILCEKIIFTRYVFIEAESISNDMYYNIKKIDGVQRFLGFGKPEPLPEREAVYIRWLDNRGRPIEPSKIFVTPEGVKFVISGILRKYKEKPIEYNLRQRKAVIIVSLSGIEHRITLPVVEI